MTLLDMCNPTNLSCKSEIDEILLQYDGFIRTVARKYISRTITSAEVLDLDIDDLVQITRIKFWLALQKQDIRNKCAFIKRIVHNEAINMVRQHKPVVPLIIDEEGELYVVHVLITSGQGRQDPTEGIEYEEMLQSYSSKLTAYVPKLPPQQQRALICALKDQIADILPLVDLFLQVNIDSESMHWSEDAAELQSERSSLSVARKKMRAFKADSCV